ncbi:MAG: hypothetical protein ACQETV_06380 [Actinomycetota bacterium]
MTEEAEAGRTPRFVWVDEEVALLGGQWMAVADDAPPHPLVLADVVVEAAARGWAEEPIGEHVRATLAVVRAAGELEDELFPDAASRLQTTLLSVDTNTPEVDVATPEGERVRRGAEALEKLAADLAEVVEAQLHDGSLASLPEQSTLALCYAVETAWRLRRLIDPPGPLYL